MDYDKEINKLTKKAEKEKNDSKKSTKDANELNRERKQSEKKGMWKYMQ